jgi:hypothetical protein
MAANAVGRAGAVYCWVFNAKGCIDVLVLFGLRESIEPRKGRGFVPCAESIILFTPSFSPDGLTPVGAQQKWLQKKGRKWHALT